MSKISYDKVHKYFDDFLRQSIEDNLDLKYVLEVWNSTEQKNSLKSQDFNKNSKDPNKPKKNTSAYLWFCSDNRRNVRKELGDLPKATEITKELANRWKELKKKSVEDEESRKLIEQYENRSIEDKQRYENEMEVYNKSIGVNKKDNVKTPFMFFYEENKEEIIKDSNNTITVREVRKQLTEHWKLLKQDKNKVEDYLKYKNKAKEYNKSHA